MKRSFHKFVALTCTLFFGGSMLAHAAEKLPIINEANGFVISEASDAVALARIEERWIVAGSNGEDASWLALFDQKVMKSGESSRLALVKVARDSSRLLRSILAELSLQVYRRTP